MINAKKTTFQETVSMNCTERKKKHSWREAAMVGVGGHPGQEQLRYSTPAMSSEGRQQGSGWALCVAMDIIVQQGEDKLALQVSEDKQVRVSNV